MPNVVLCYFAQDVSDYTPVDIGYAVATAVPSVPSDFDFKIEKMTYRRKYGNGLDLSAARETTIESDTHRILAHKPDAVFFFIDSVLWSKVFALGRAEAISQKLRHECPNLLLVVCSHKIDSETRGELVRKSIVDAILLGDAERAFLQLPNILAKSPVIGVTYTNATGHFAGVLELVPDSVAHALIPKSLDDVPSPYLTHVLDGFLTNAQRRRDGRFRAFLYSARGCQFSCYFCSRSVKFEKVRYFSAERFYDEVEYLLENFGIFKFFVLDDAFLCSKKRLKELNDEYEKRKNKNKNMEFVSFYVMARPESIDYEVIDFMSRLGVRYLQIGLQTVNPDIQEYMGRPIDVEYFSQINQWLKKYKIALQLDVILGLPGDTAEGINDTLSFAVSLEPRSIQLKQFYLNPYTLFALRSNEYKIELDADRDIFDSDFDAPYVVSAIGIDEEYFSASGKHIREHIQSNQQINWKYLSKRDRFVSPKFYPGVPRN